LDAGLALIDTAEVYGAGEVERIVGRALAGRRQSVYLVTKVAPRLGPPSAYTEACAASLRRLGTDYVDLYLLHWNDPACPIEVALEALERLRRQGKILDFGVSNFGVQALEHAVRLAGPGRIAANQILYNLGYRDPELSQIPAATRLGVPLIAYSPLNRGHVPAPHTIRGLTLRRIAHAHDATSQQIALAFLLRRRGVFAVPKASRCDHLQANAEAARIELSAAEIRAIADVFPPSVTDRSLRARTRELLHRLGLAPTVGD
jgi:diketogulonate reductase-like aldo/keto reductase